MTIDVPAQAEEDARWLWAELERHRAAWSTWVETPPEHLDEDARRILKLMTRLVHSALWRSTSADDLSTRFHPPTPAIGNPAETS